MFWKILSKLFLLFSFFYIISEILKIPLSMNILRYAFKNIFRNFFLSFSSILVIGLLAFFVNVLLLVLFSTEKFINTVNDRISITINLQSGMNDTTARVRTLMRGISGAFTGISLEYVSQVDALALLSDRNPDLAWLIEHGDENPLPNSLRLKNIALDSYRELNIYISSFRDVLEYDEADLSRKIVDYRAQYSRIESIIHGLRILEYWVYFLLFLFAFTVFIVIHTIIRNFIFYLRDEIEIIELVGGKSSFIYGPFVLQGLFYTAVASIVSFFLFYLSLFFFMDMSGIAFLKDWFSGFLEVFGIWGVYAVLLFMIIGVISAFFTSFRYVHSTIASR